MTKVGYYDGLRFDRLVHQEAETPDGRRTFTFDPGPVFANLVLADEINRATPKSQSALLEAMQERQVTVAGETRPLPRPFLVMATQNPLEMEGTYPLPEAQLDRFLLKAHVPFPSAEELVAVVDRTTGKAADVVEPVVDEIMSESVLREVYGIPVEVSAFGGHRVVIARRQPGA